MTDLRYDYLVAHDTGELRHAEIVLQELGITWQRSRPESIADSFYFFDCNNVPPELPSFITTIAELIEDEFKCP